ncbi:hypothetical protein AB5J62_19890 [Amycolatopsis sp. cg5]|uniref:hypothetical protein n=1 Tax=Amycolatopsis sp. cg5 TaxID=3238802 RepID=UPI0035256C42
MDQQTRELSRALLAANEHIPRVATELLTGTLPPGRQHEFAALLIELGELLHSHADDNQP